MLKNLLYRLGGLMLVIGAVLPLFTPTIGAYVFALGVALFCPIQMGDRYEGSNIVVRHLRRQQMLGALMLVVTAALMLTTLYQIPPFRAGEWRITLIIAAVLEVYAIFRIDHEEKKEQRTR